MEGFQQTYLFILFGLWYENYPRIKSSFLHHGVKDGLIGGISDLLSVPMFPIEMGFRYLGYWLKTLSYCVKDWRWIIGKFEGKISHWTYRFLSIEGRLTIIRSTLYGIPVFWSSLAKLPCSILITLRQRMFNFL